jgi:hypothetical protein
MRKLRIIDKKTCKILQQRNAYLSDPDVPPGVQERVDHNLLKLAGEVIVRQTMDMDGEPGGLQCVNGLYERLGMHLPNYL